MSTELSPDFIDKSTDLINGERIVKSATRKSVNARSSAAAVAPLLGHTAQMIAMRRALRSPTGQLAQAIDKLI